MTGIDLEAIDRMADLKEIAAPLGVQIRPGTSKAKARELIRAAQQAPNPAVEPDPTGPVEREYEVTGEHHVIHHPQTGEPVGLHGDKFRAVYPPATEARLIAAGHIKRVQSDADTQEG